MISKWGGLKIDENRGYTQSRLFYRENADSPGLGICLGYFQTNALQDRKPSHLLATRGPQKPSEVPGRGSPHHHLSKITMEYKHT